ncbi:MAG: hypothetical protein WD969_15875, partial [Paracoccaceae bacterium]
DRDVYAPVVDQQRRRAETAGEGLKAALVRAGGAADFDDLERKLAAARAGALAIVDRLLP